MSIGKGVKQAWAIIVRGKTIHGDHPLEEEVSALPTEAECASAKDDPGAVHRCKIAGFLLDEALVELRDPAEAKVVA